MNDLKKISAALISVYHKDNLEEIVRKLDSLNVKLYSTGGTKDFIESLKIKVTAVEDVTAYPSIFGGRVKTLHPKIFGGILFRRDNAKDLEEAKKYEIPPVDLVIVDLYPFEETVASGAADEDIIEKIDIGGISLIRATAKNFNDVVIVPSKNEYNKLLDILNERSGVTTLEERKWFAASAFNVSSHYDSAIFNYFNKSQNIPSFKQSISKANTLRYGENPHQKGVFFGDLEKMFSQLHGKEISYNNLLDIDAAVGLIAEFDEPTFAILKHNNACGIASRNNLLDAWKDALAGDPVSAYGGVLITNREIDEETANEVNQLFFEIVVAPSYSESALEILKSKKNRIILIQKPVDLPKTIFRSLLNGVVSQDKDISQETEKDLQTVTNKTPGSQEITDLIFANKIVKHTKSNAIVLAKNKQLCASGVGQTSRVDALKQAISKAASFGFDLQGAVMASDAFFPFNDCVELAHDAGINSVIQPGGSVRDNDSIEYCNSHNMAMVFTGIRHFKH
jgi:phosphoribosylaminoimidazolecarboxamide formyltransferase / IMP cyclohydrolase